MEPTPIEPMITIEHLSKRFGPLIAVDDVSFSVGRGDVLGFLGPNGAGKSTTMRLITGFITPDAGRVEVGGFDVTADPVAVKQRIGYLPEGAPLYGDMTVEGFLQFVAEVRGFRGAEASARIDEVIAKVSLESVVAKPVATLSKGFKRRVGLAQAIVHDPEVLILDEPTDGLDPNQKHEVRNLIRSMSHQKVIVLSTHILEEVDAVCNRAIIIADGKIVSNGTPAELLARSKYHNAVRLSVRGMKLNGMRGDLESLPEVASVEVLESSDEYVLLEIFPNAGASVIASVSERARERGWAIEELHVERGRLDDVFREVTAGASSVS